MRFPNAHQGVKRMLVVEILVLLFLTLPFLSRFLAFQTLRAEASYDYVFSEYITAFRLNERFASGCQSVYDTLPWTAFFCGIAAAVMQMLLFGQIIQDEPKFAKCRFLTCVICLLNVIRILVPLINLDGFVQSMFPWMLVDIAGFDLLDLTGFLCAALITLFSVQGIKNLADRLDDTEMVRRGSRLLFQNLALLLAYPILFVISTDKTIPYVCVLENELMFLLYLSRAEEMLLYGETKPEDTSLLGAAIEFEPGELDAWQ